MHGSVLRAGVGRVRKGAQNLLRQMAFRIKKITEARRKEQASRQKQDDYLRDAAGAVNDVRKVHSEQISH